MTAPGAQGEVSPESMGKTASSADGSPPDAKPASPRTTGNHAEQNRLNPCRGKPFHPWKELKFESQKGNSRLIRHEVAQALFLLRSSLRALERGAILVTGGGCDDTHRARSRQAAPELSKICAYRILRLGCGFIFYLSNE